MGPAEKRPQWPARPYPTGLRLERLRIRGIYAGSLKVKVKLLSPVRPFVTLWTVAYCGQESLRRNGVAIMVNKRVQNAVIGCNLKNDRMISVHLHGKLFNITVIQIYAPTSNAEEAEVERFYEDVQDLLELTPKRDVLFIIGDWNAKLGSQETPGVTGKFGLGMRNEAGQRLIEFCQENALVIANTLFQQHRRRLYTWASPDGQH